jgi:hypothetical protein
MKASLAIMRGSYVILCVVDIHGCETNNVDRTLPPVQPRRTQGLAQEQISTWCGDPKDGGLPLCWVSASVVTALFLSSPTAVVDLLFFFVVEPMAGRGKSDEET